MTLPTFPVFLSSSVKRKPPIRLIVTAATGSLCTGCRSSFNEVACHSADCTGDLERCVRENKRREVVRSANEQR
ncbi:hypothetical protein BD311DRAFT_760177 [Dichomitus squalens]|uniref:Uncharacterized protein n=1 Tax=Dichomitus squalens TaxID=114155 RepID=A0A4Q9MIX8_9APHY|nr:hypothetical protein BD311DRAFT_760177 [Dichomitus squalens]